MDQEIIGSGAEALIIKEKDYVLKRRIKKSYRIEEIDEKLRKIRTRSEAKIIEKLFGLINVPKIIHSSDKTKEIKMQYVGGKKLSDYLDKLKNKKDIIKKIAGGVAKIHNLDIIHGDLTTSNIIYNAKEDKVYFIDFGLGFHSSKIEDKAVDIHLFKQALEAKHFNYWQELFDIFIENYNSKDKDKILLQLKKVEARGRYRH
ncbi:MAG: KEOPS complex kinase/ATPase Bud32 [Candidatus Nanoarchaeia archaeon]